MVMGVGALSLPPPPPHPSLTRLNPPPPPPPSLPPSPTPSLTLLIHHSPTPLPLPSVTCFISRSTPASSPVRRSVVTASVPMERLGSEMSASMSSLHRVTTTWGGGGGLLGVSVVSQSVDRGMCMIGGLGVVVW